MDEMAPYTAGLLHPREGAGDSRGRAGGGGWEWGWEWAGWKELVPETRAAHSKDNPRATA